VAEGVNCIALLGGNDGVGAPIGEPSVALLLFRHQTNHQERWNNTLRQWLGRYTRKSLSFSKQDAYHSLVTHWFIILHNLTIRSSLTL